MYISLCLICKNEDPYIKEWLDYYILLGVEHFFIYDNESTIPLTQTISEYIARGWVTVNVIRGKGMQLYAYDHCIQTYGGLSKWIGFIDTDEFIIPKTGEDLPGFVRHYESFSGLAISSLFFGAGGNKVRPLCGQIAGYLKRTPENLLKNRLVKCIVQPEKVLFPSSPHTFLYSDTNYCVNEMEHRVDTQFFSCSVQKIQLNHYYTRSVQEWKEKNVRGRGDSGLAYSEINWKEVEDNSTVDDQSAINLVIDLLRKKSNRKDAVDQLSKPSSTKLLQMLSSAARQIQAPKCTAIPDQEINPRPEMIDLMQAIAEGNAFLDSGQFHKARAVYLRLIEQFPQQIAYYIDFAITCNKQGDYESAWEAIAQTWKMSPRNWTVLTCMIDYFFGISNFEQVEKCTLLLNEYGSVPTLNIAGLAIAQWNLGKKQLARNSAKLLLEQLTPELIASHSLYQEVVKIISEDSNSKNRD